MLVAVMTCLAALSARSSLELGENYAILSTCWHPQRTSALSPIGMVVINVNMILRMQSESLCKNFIYITLQFYVPWGD